jgi:hypothetical protein
MGRVAEFFQVPIDWTKSFEPQFLAQLGPAYVEA